MKETRKFRVSGVVQEVWYRKFATDKATELGLHGWVRNTDDGRVELIASGSVEQLGELEAWLWEGSPMSNVDSVESESSSESVRNGFTTVW